MGVAWGALLGSGEVFKDSELIVVYLLDRARFSRIVILSFLSPRRLGVAVQVLVGVGDVAQLRQLSLRLTVQVLELPGRLDVVGPLQPLRLGPRGAWVSLLRDS